MAQHGKNISSGPLNIDVEAVLRDRLGDKSRRIPRWLIRRLEAVICQDRLNEMLRMAYPRRGADFCRAVLDHLDIKVNLRGQERLPADSRIIISSNHPLGGLDGMALIDTFTRIYGEGVKFVVNDLLSAVEPLSDVFLPVNKHGVQSREALAAIDAAMAGDKPVIVFPAGLCSRRHGKTVADKTWNKMFITKARQFQRDIVPVHFVGENSSRFYRAAQWRERLGIKFNCEMILLPSEIFRAEGKTFDIICGEPISHETLGGDALQTAAEIRQNVYQLT